MPRFALLLLARFAVIYGLAVWLCASVPVYAWIEAGAPEFIDLITSENEEYQARLGGGMLWLDATCQQRFGKVFLESAPEQQKEILDLIAHRRSEDSDPTLRTGIQFFSFLRKLTADGFFTSEIGIQYLGYIGNEFLDEFPGCPPVPEV